jgi:SAM-dependent methyltransferase
MPGGCVTEEHDFELVRTPMGYLSVRPLPSSEELSAYYAHKYFGDGEAKGAQYASDYPAEERTNKTLAAREAAHLASVEAGSVFEVGFGEGFALSWLRERGWDVSGVDFSAEGLERFHPELRSHVRIGDAYQVLDEVIDGTSRFDLVICNNVLEHVRDPEAFLPRLRRLLTPSGLVRIQVPNDGSWIQELAVERGAAQDQFFVAYPEHLHYFTAAPLRRVLEASGFEVVALLGDFPIDLFLLNPDSAYTADRARGPNCHAARLAFENALAGRSIEELVAFRSGCAAAGVGRNLIAYARDASGKRS